MQVRDAHEGDAAGVTELYRAVYGDDFPFQEFYDALWIKKGIFDDDIAWVVAEEGGDLIGSAAVMLNAGDADDLIGEFGRLVVLPDSRSRGAGTALIEGLIDRVAPHIEWGFGECRTVHPGAQKICLRTGFGPIGFEPCAYTIGERRESMALMARLFGSAVHLRRNNPRVIPSVFAIGSQAMGNLELEPDLVVAEGAHSYPWDDELTVAELDDTEGPRLLRIGRGRAWDREIHGGVRLEYGYLKLISHDVRYLVAKRGDVPVGAVGYSYDHIDDKVRVSELFATDDATKGTLLRELLSHVIAEHDPVYTQVDVSAHSPRMQATLQQLGFFPAGYCPAMVFEGVERLDVVRMVRLGVPWGPGPLEMIPECAAMRDLVQQGYEELNKGRTALDVARGVHLFQGLGDDEIERVRAICHRRDCHAGERLFASGDPSRELYIVLKGRVEILPADGKGRRLAEVGEGEVFGEMALIDEGTRSAAAVCPGPASLLVIEYGDFHHLMREEPEIGHKVMHNLARTVSQRLRDTDRRLEWGLAVRDA